MADARTIAASCLLQATRRAARAVTALYEAALAPVDLTASQFSALVAIGAAGGAPLGGIAEGLGLDRTTLTRVLAPLERRGLVASAPDPRDARARVLRLTPAGEALLADAAPLWGAAQAEALRRLGPALPGYRDALGRIE